MESIPRTLTLVLLSLWSVGAAPSPNGTTLFALQPKDAVDAEYSDMLFPGFFDSLEDESRDSKHVGSLLGGLYKLDPGQTVTIQSPKYPDRFPYLVMKKWTFLGTSTSSTISITCTDVTLDSCWYSSITIWGLNLFKIYCDTQSTFTATSENNHLNVRFFSKFLKNYGFQCTVTASETTTTTSTSTSTTSTSTTSTATTSTSTTSTTTTTPEPYQCQCGRRNPVERIIGGQETTVHEYPWQVAITYGSSTPICGGAIISDKWILTSAYCVDGSDVTVVVGEHDWSVTDETSITQMIVPSTIIMHPSYNRTNGDNNVALIELRSAVNFLPDNTIAPVCLPDEDNDYSDVDATVTGWGGSQSETLQEVVVPTMTNAACANIFPAVTDNMICTGTDDGGPCVGDTGCPLVAPGNTDETFMVEIGIHFGGGCGSSGDPTVYTRVSKYVSWINEIIAGSVTCPRP